MKKTLLLTTIFLLLMTVSLFAGTTKVYGNKCTLDTGEMANVDNVGNTTNANYIVTADILETVGEVVTTQDPAPGELIYKNATQIRIFKAGNGTSTPYYTASYLNAGCFPTQWLNGNTIRMTVTYIPTGETVAWETPIVSGTMNYVTPELTKIIPPFTPVTTDTWNYNLTVNGPAGYTFTGGGATDAAMGTILHDDDDLEPNTLIGEYTASTPAVGYHWVDPIITVTEGMFTAAKADVVKNATITFELVVNDMEIVDVPVLDIPSLPAGLPTSNEITGAVFVTWFGTQDLFIPALPGQTSAMAFIGGSWIPGGAPNWTWTGVNFNGKGIIPVVFFGPPAPLPVELSSFAATLTAQNFVKLTWVSETETGLSGYRVYRNDSADQATAIVISELITPTNTSQTQTYTHIDNEVSPATNYSYWLEVVEMDGTTAFHGPTNVYVEPAAVVVPSLVTTMDNAYPNPFKTNSSTSIAYQVKAGEAGTITIYNIIGQVVKTVPVTETTSPKTFTWNGRDSKGNACGSGIYFYKLSTPSRNVTKKMVIVN
jgi:hypothetical protein